LQDGRSAKDFAVLYRMNAQSRAIEDALRRRRIPYVIYGGVRFYDRKEIKDALAYIRLILNPRSDVDFTRIVNVPPRGLGKTSLDRIGDLARDRGLSLVEAAGIAAQGEVKLTSKAKQAIDRLLGVITKTQVEAFTEEPGRVIENVLEDVGYLQMLRLEGTEESASRLENLQELVAGVDEYAERAEEPSLAGFLEEVALATDLDKMAESDEQVVLMTLHAAKGLEFPVVFLPGMEEMLFPHGRSMDDRAGREEERRLCYVGSTRAKELVHLSAARVRYVFGEVKLSEPSRFLSEIPVDLLDAGQRPLRRLESSGGPAHDDYFRDAMPDDDIVAPPKQRAYTMRSSERDAFPPGTPVRHATFGEGKVLASEGEGVRRKLTVRFTGLPEPKVIVARFVERV
jgi:DNA helicase-2/ATP-dependent DNA helicase PcrA